MTKKADVYSLDGTKESSLKLPAIFAVEPKKAVLHQAVVTYLANQRAGTAHTKTRAEVAGGGRKPWRQKGTGRARAGSIRSPLWTGGGVTFGPRTSRNYRKRLPTQLKRLATAMALSAKAEAGDIIVVSDLTLKTPKTKEAATVLAKLVPKATSLLVVTAKPNAMLLQATRNLPAVAVVPANELNAFDVLSFSKILLTKEAIELAEQQFGNKVKEK